jgi:serine/threonine-protein kinase
MQGILSGLAFAHDKGIVHRDIKPSNLMVTPNGVKIMDFGIAHVTMMKTLTATGMIVGTPSHMAPEQISGSEDIDARADVYAAGVIFYQLLTHKLPYPQKTNDPLAILMRKMEGPPPPPRSLNDAISIELNDLVLSLLAVDREHRCGSAHDALRLVNAARRSDS